MAEAAQKQQRINYELASPQLLSEQPNSLPNKKDKAKANPEWVVLQGHLEASITAMRQWRNSWWYQNWANLAEYILPRRSIWLTQSTGGNPSPNDMSRGKPINNSIKDPTATYAARVCSAGLMSGLASPSRPWFKMKPAIKNIEIPADGRQWMDQIEDRMYTVLASSNFYNSFAQECEDEVVFGTAPSIIYEDKEDIIRCYNPCVGEYFLAVGATLRINKLGRVFVMTMSQAVDFFGLKNCTPEIQDAWKAKGAALEQELTIAHLIEPNYDIEGCPKIPGKYTWREVYWVFGSGSIEPLSKCGFIEQPFTAARWSTQSNDAYGRSVGMDVLPDVIQLQVETVRKAEGIEKGLRPPLIADMTMKNQPSSILPGHVTYVTNLGPNTGMRSIYDVNFDLNHITKDIADIQQRIAKGFFNDLFLMLSENPTQKQTAYEVAQKVQEKLQVLGPVIENIITESLKPKLKRIYGIMQRRGLIPPKPDSIKNIPLDIEFISMLALAQKASKTGGLERLGALIGNMVAVYPQAKDLLNVDNFINEMNDMLDNPNDILRGPEELSKIRQAAAQQQAMAAKMQAAQHMAETAKTGAEAIATGADAAGVLANTQVGAGTAALSPILGGQQSGSFNG